MTNPESSRQRVAWLVKQLQTTEVDRARDFAVKRAFIWSPGSIAAINRNKLDFHGPAAVTKPRVDQIHDHQLRRERPGSTS